MRLGIETRTLETKVNIEGRVLERTQYYVIYKGYLFGLIRRYVDFISPLKGLKGSGDMLFDIVRKGYATHLNKSTAEEILADMKANPDRYYQVKR